MEVHPNVVSIWYREKGSEEWLRYCAAFDVPVQVQKTLPALIGETIKCASNVVKSEHGMVSDTHPPCPDISDGKIEHVIQYTRDGYEFMVKIVVLHDLGSL